MGRAGDRSWPDHLPWGLCLQGFPLSLDRPPKLPFQRGESAGYPQLGTCQPLEGLGHSNRGSEFPTRPELGSSQEYTGRPPIVGPHHPDAAQLGVGQVSGVLSHRDTCPSFLAVALCRAELWAQRGHAGGPGQRGSTGRGADGARLAGEGRWFHMDISSRGPGSEPLLCQAVS